jgi:MoxR-like ATPase
MARARKTAVAPVTESKAPVTESNPATAPEASTTAASQVFCLLGIEGLGALAPVLLAALVTAEPLLLIGAHGTGKSLLLLRIGEALGLSVRHYNASLLNFDDLLGFPLPAKDGTLQYVGTPAAIWGAGAVIFDEVSRCRPDIQNKLFPIIHERRAQGLLLESLRYRWAAMNPPATEHSDSGYLGSEPLDPALADRFAYIVRMPDWEALSEVEQLRVIRSESLPVPAVVALQLQQLVAQAGSLLLPVSEQLGAARGVYVRALMALTAQAGIHLSARRAAMLHRNIAAIHAVRSTLDLGAQAEDSAWLAVAHGIPQHAEGKTVAEGKLFAAHKEAVRIAGLKAGDPIAQALLTRDPLLRLHRAVHSTLPRGDLSTLVADAFAQLRPGQRDAVAYYLFQTGLAGRLNAAIAEQLAARYQNIEDPIVFSETWHASHPRYRAWQVVKNALSRLDPLDAQAHRIANGIAAAFQRKELETEAQIHAACEDIPVTEALLFGAVA